MVVSRGDCETIIVSLLGAARVVGSAIFADEHSSRRGVYVPPAALLSKLYYTTRSYNSNTWTTKLVLFLALFVLTGDDRTTSPFRLDVLSSITPLYASGMVGTLASKRTYVHGINILI